MLRIINRLLPCSLMVFCLVILNGSALAAGNVIPVDTAFSIAVNPNTQRVYVGGDGHLYVIDSSNNTLADTLDRNGRFFYMAANPTTNRIYAVDTLNNDVVVLNGATNAFVTTIDISGPPNGIAVDPARNLIYVTNGASGNIEIIDGTSNTIIDSILIGNVPGSVAVNPTTNRIYAAHDLNQIAVVNGSTRAFIKDIEVSDNPVDLTINTFTNKVYAATTFNYDSTLEVIDGDSNTFLKSVAITGNARNLSVNSITNRIYVAVAPPTGKTGSVVIVNGETDTVASTLTLGKLSFDIGADSTTSRIYALTLVGSGTAPSVESVSTEGTPGDVRPLASQGGDAITVYQDVLPAPVAPKRDFYRIRKPTLSWSPVDWATAYEIQIDNTSNFSGKPLKYQHVFEGDATLKAAPDNNLEDGVYYWRVRARHADNSWGGWSAVQTFEVDA